jgi:hypothetical protein
MIEINNEKHEICNTGCSKGPVNQWHEIKES